MELYGEEAGQWVDPLDTMSHCVGNMMNQAIFSVRYGRRDPTWTYLQRIAKEGAAKLGTLAPVNFLPFLRFLPSVRRNIQTIKWGRHNTHSYSPRNNLGRPSVSSSRSTSS